MHGGTVNKKFLKYLLSYKNHFPFQAKKAKKKMLWYKKKPVAILAKEIL
jgi:hypothetical protein